MAIVFRDREGGREGGGERQRELPRNSRAIVMAHGINFPQRAS